MGTLTAGIRYVRENCRVAWLRGRVMALFVLCFIGMQPFSSLAFGWLGGAIGPESAITIGAIVLLIYATFLLIKPGLLQPRKIPIHNHR
ncbi:MAG: hypothetical protein M1539_01340 [Actinobacteria bacterium]|nr:hypothetical protein [Actinomycetota bacterium]MCL5882618.1 hypothetical protein [Actinomycetota bacterium]